MVVICHMLDRLVFVADRELQSCFLDVIEQCVGALVERAVIPEVLHPVPVHDDAVDAAELHQQDLVFQQRAVAGVVGAGERIVVRGDVLLPFWCFFAGVKMVHRPMVAPIPVPGWGLVPGHVMGHQQGLARFSLLWCRRRCHCWGLRGARGRCWLRRRGRRCGLIAITPDRKKHQRQQQKDFEPRYSLCYHKLSYRKRLQVTGYRFQG